jgi:thioredoxin 1
MKMKIILYLIVLATVPLILLTSYSCSAPVDITRISLEDVITNGKPTLVDFAGTDCIPCKLMKPMLEELEKEYRGKVNVVIVEYYHNTKLADRYAVSAIPTQILFDAQSKELMRHKGFWSKEEMASELKKLTTE